MINEHDIKDMQPGGVTFKEYVKEGFLQNAFDKAISNKNQLQKVMVGGQKFDQEKPPMALLDADFLEGVARVLGFGASKYAAHNWRNGITYSRLISAAYRHLGAINRGEDIDPESGLSHAYHLGCCIMFLASMMNTRPDLDDRWKNKHEQSLY